MQRLRVPALRTLPTEVERPRFARDATTVGVVHLGLGAFHRAHQAVYFDDVLARGERDWAVCGVSLRSNATRARLAPQNGLYTLVERGPRTTRLRVIGALKEVLAPQQVSAAALSRIASKGVRIVSLTVTEKGYCHDPLSGTLDFAHPDIIHDLAQPNRPRSAVGVLVAGLAWRYEAGLGPLTVLCCDDLQHNGRLVRGVTLAFARALDAALADWIAREVSFPSTVADRIVPATTAADRALVAQRLGYEDAAPVVAEPFRQWLVEDAFCAGRPALDAVGVALIGDAAPFAAMKLRLLDGGQSALAYLGHLAGLEHVHEAMADAAFAGFVERLMTAEVTPTLVRPTGIALTDYCAAVLRRFGNAGAHHRLAQVAADGSHKLPQRLLGAVRDRLAAGASARLLTLAVAGWMRYVVGYDERGRLIDVRDPLAVGLRARAKAAGGDPAAWVDALLGVREVFGDDLPAAHAFRSELVAALETILRRGARAAVSVYTEE